MSIHDKIITVEELQYVFDELVNVKDLDLNYSSWSAVAERLEGELTKYPYSGETREDALKALKVAKKIKNLIEEIKQHKSEYVSAAFRKGEFVSKSEMKRQEVLRRK